LVVVLGGNNSILVAIQIFSLILLSYSYKKYR